MNRNARIRQILENALQPTLLEIRDDSHKHAGHAGARPEGETHFHITIQSSKLNGLSRVEAHRTILILLQPEMQTGLHAVSLDVS